MKRRDVNQIAFATLKQATGEWPKEAAEQRKAEAAELGNQYRVENELDEIGFGDDSD